MNSITSPQFTTETHHTATDIKAVEKATTLNGVTDPNPEPNPQTKTSPPLFYLTDSPNTTGGGDPLPPKLRPSGAASLYTRPRNPWGV